MKGSRFIRLCGSRWLLASAALVALGCTQEIDPTAVELRGACPADRASGRFVVELHPAYSVLDGQVSNGVVPATVPEEVRRDGDCVLLRRINPHCSPACASGQVCGTDGRCVPAPVGQPIGQVAVGGLNGGPLVLEPRDPGARYFDTTIPHPVFEPGAVVTIESTGGTYDPLKLRGVGAEALESDDTDWAVSRGRPLALSWTPPNGVLPTRLGFRLTVDQHGASPLRIECSFPDTGSAQVPATLIDAMLDAGITGYPNGAMSRQTVDSVAYRDGCVELRVRSPLRGSVTVEGHRPCSSDADCPGTSCDTAINTCRRME